jgi:hypothetical protein
VYDMNVQPFEDVAEPRPAGSETTIVVALPSGRGSVFCTFLEPALIFHDMLLEVLPVRPPAVPLKLSSAV